MFGVNAFIMVFCVSGFLEGWFFYVGFLLYKSKERRLKIVKILNVLVYLEEKILVVFYESLYWLLEILKDLNDLVKGMYLFVVKEFIKFY